MVKVVPGRIKEALNFRLCTTADLAKELQVPMITARHICFDITQPTPQQLMIIVRMTRFPIRWFTQEAKVNYVDEGSFYCDLHVRLGWPY